MARFKSLLKKAMLGRAMRRAKPVPLWVVRKTMRRVRISKRWRSWRRSKLRIKAR